jgi:hypothetical protein
LTARRFAVVRKASEPEDEKLGETCSAAVFASSSIGESSDQERMEKWMFYEIMRNA